MGGKKRDDPVLPFGGIWIYFQGAQIGEFLGMENFGFPTKSRKKRRPSHD